MTHFKTSDSAINPCYIPHSSSCSGKFMDKSLGLWTAFANCRRRLSRFRDWRTEFFSFIHLVLNPSLKKLWFRVFQSV